MISIYLGSVGSGKTASAVRHMFLNTAKRKTYSNIVTKIKTQIDISPDMILKKEVVKTKKNKQGEEVPVYDTKLNIDYWRNIKEPINVILDEAHSILNARRSMSKVNVILTDWIALIRRILGSTTADYGELILITQLPNRLDTIARDMATHVRYHICHYKKTCRKCGFSWNENSEMPEASYECLKCGYPNIFKHSYAIEVYCFANINAYNIWNDFSNKTYYNHFLINDIEKYFKLYNTLQWDNLFSEFY